MASRTLCRTSERTSLSGSHYGDKDGNRYVDYILMESCSDNDLVYIKLRWGYSKTKVARGNRVRRKRLNKQQKAKSRFDHQASA
ncbi:unnamed protein product [Sphagnum tenellum]